MNDYHIFILVLEILFILAKSNNNITGLKIFEHDYISTFLFYTHFFAKSEVEKTPVRRHFVSET